MENKKIRTPVTATLLAISVLVYVLRWTPISSLFGIRFAPPSFAWPQILSIMIIVLDAVLCITLFAKKRNVILVYILGGYTLIRLINLVLGRLSSINIILQFVAYALLLVFALALSEPLVLKADLSQIKRAASKLFFVPGLLLLLSLFITVLRNVISGGNFFTILYVNANSILSAIAFLFLVQWLCDPYEKAVVPVTTPTFENSNSTAAEEYNEAYCGLGKHIVLCLFTFGIWYMIWIYRVTKYLNQAPGVQMYHPGKKLLLCIFIPFYQIYWFYKHGQRIDLLSKHKNLPSSDMATLCLILGIFIPIVACILMQDRINTLCNVKSSNIEV